jgi:uncharacterized repeat protein (TIGR03803 family)
MGYRTLDSVRMFLDCPRPKSGMPIMLIGTLFLAVLSPAAHGQTLTVLHDFSGPDGGTPTIGLTMDAAGNFYGTTSEGGTYRQGIVFKLTHHNLGWVLTPLYEFRGGADGGQPQSRVVFGPDGRLYGTTTAGGEGGSGTVYSLTPPPHACGSLSCPWQETVIHSFMNVDGINPEYGDLVFDSAGNIYGTTKAGGSYFQGGFDIGYGTVYELSPSNGGWTQTVLYSFSDGDDGASPYSGVVFDQAGNLYGTTSAGGANNSGTIYELSPSASGWTETTIRSLAGAQDGSNPTAGLTPDEAGGFYGAATYGGSGGYGTVFHLTPAGSGWNFAVIFGFSLNGTGESPYYNLLLAGGNLYAALAGAVDHDFGSVIELSPSTGGWTETILHNFILGQDGGEPVGPLVIDASGNLYGESNLGGTYGPGLIWEITP